MKIKYFQILILSMIFLFSISIFKAGARDVPAKTLTKLQSEIVIRGIVKDDGGLPLPGVSVVVKGTKKGTSTGSEGNFVVSAKKNDILVFSMIGFQTVNHTVLKEEKNLLITLKGNVSELNEVVVVAYGQQKRATITGSIATISTKELKQSPVSNITNSLAGRLPGLITTQRSGEPGVDGSALYIRGIKTTNVSNPIVMVDGVERSMDYLDPNDIESINILKDAAATAVLGMRGANGAILVTTKRGKIGEPEVNFRASAGFQEATRLPSYLGSYDYARLRNQALINDGQKIAFSDAELEGYKNGSLPNTDYYKFLMKPSMVAQANLNVNGGTNTARYFISAGFNRQEGNYKHTKDNADGYNSNNIMDRYNLRANVDVDISPTLLARVDVAGTLTSRNDGNISAGDVMNLANRMPPIYPIFNEDGSLFGNGTYSNNLYGMLTSKGYRRFYNNTVQGTFSMTKKLDFITKNLSAKASFSYDNTNTPTSSYGRDYAVYQPLFDDEGKVISYRKFGNDTKIDPNGSFNGGDARRNTYLEAVLNWNNKFNDHEVSAMLLGNRRLQSQNSVIPYAYQSLLFRGTYNFKSKYLIEFSSSYQGSENFPKKSRYGFFPSISGGWVLSEEGFLKNQVSFLDYLKLRASYGEVGNDRSGAARFLWLTSWGGADPYWFGKDAQQANGWSQGSVGNEGVTWERGRQINVGVEARLWKDALSFTFDMFKEHRTKILRSRNTLSDVFGQGIKPQNIGIVDSKGFELELNHTMRLGDFRYFIKPNVTLATNKIINDDEVKRLYPWMRRTGHPVGTKFGLISEGFFQNEEDVKNSPKQNFSDYGPGDIKYKKLTGEEYGFIQESFDETVIGKSRTPELMYGASVGFDYKRFDFTMLFQGAGRADVRLDNEAVYEFFQEGKVKPFHMNSWTPETAQTATYPRLHSNTNKNNHRASSFWVKDASYLRIKNAEIGYQLPASIASKMKLSFFRLYINGMNLHTWDKLKDYQVDPEIGDGNGAMYPIQKVWNFGIDIRL